MQASLITLIAHAGVDHDTAEAAASHDTQVTGTVIVCIAVAVILLMLIIQFFAHKKRAKSK